MNDCLNEKKDKVNRDGSMTMTKSISCSDFWLKTYDLELIYLTFYEGDTDQNLIIQWDGCENKKVNIFLGNDVLVKNIDQHRGTNTIIIKNFYQTNSTLVKATETRELFYRLTGFFMPLPHSLLQGDQTPKLLSIRPGLLHSKISSSCMHIAKIQRNRFNIGSFIKEACFFFGNDNHGYVLVQLDKKDRHIDLKNATNVLSYQDFVNVVPRLNCIILFRSVCGRYILYQSEILPITIASGKGIILFFVMFSDGRMARFYPRQLIHI